ncbi:MAG: hypothetical protein ACFC1C_00220 [Candidatus Malihini olakiniferum]
MTQSIKQLLQIFKSPVWVSSVRHQQVSLAQNVIGPMQDAMESLVE